MHATWCQSSRETGANCLGTVGDGANRAFTNIKPQNRVLTMSAYKNTRRNDVECINDMNLKLGLNRSGAPTSRCYPHIRSRRRLQLIDTRDPHIFVMKVQ